MENKLWVVPCGSSPNRKDGPGIVFFCVGVKHGRDRRIEPLMNWNEAGEMDMFSCPYLFPVFLSCRKIQSPWDSPACFWTWGRKKRQYSCRRQWAVFLSWSLCCCTPVTNIFFFPFHGIMFCHCWSVDFLRCESVYFQFPGLHQEMWYSLDCKRSYSTGCGREMHGRRLGGACLFMN